ncbi:hypothetical protein D3C72_1915870 [compost metagenome]
MECRGYCYTICFSILEVFKQGTIKFIAVKNLLADGESNDYEYTMHVLYVNNEWAFDTFSHRQLPLDELLALYKCKEYKDFSFSDIIDLSYEEFTDLNYEKLKLWCKENSVFQKWKTD